MWMIATSFRLTHSPSWLAWSEGWRPPGAQSTFIRWTGWTLAMTGYDDSTINTVSLLLLLLLLLYLSGTLKASNQQFMPPRLSSRWGSMHYVYGLSVYLCVYVPACAWAKPFSDLPSSSTSSSPKLFLFPLLSSTLSYTNTFIIIAVIFHYPG